MKFCYLLTWRIFFLPHLKTHDPLIHTRTVLKRMSGGLSLDRFLSKETLLQHLLSQGKEEMIVEGDKLKEIHCCVFGPIASGKSALLQLFIGRQPSDPLPSNSGWFATNAVELTDATRKTLILQEIPEDDARSLLVNRELLAKCDVVVFVYDSSDEFSCQRAKDMLVKVATYGETTGYKAPCLIVATKDDLGQSPHALQESTRVSQDIGIETPIPISVESERLEQCLPQNSACSTTAPFEIPETEAGKTSRRYRQLLNRSVMVTSAGAAVTVVVIAAHGIYAARANKT